MAEYRVYKRRWVVLFLFSASSALNSLHWTQFTIIYNIVLKYYGVSESYVDWTSMIFMLLYIPLVLPASWYLEKVGLRNTALTGMFGTCLACWIKMFAARPHLFNLAFVGQSVASAANVFLLSLPSRIAAVWFGQDQVSTACGVGVVGNQVGVAFAFVLPPLLVPNSDNMDEIGRHLLYMYYYYAAVSTLLMVLMLFFFYDKPPTPPSAAVGFVDNEPFTQSVKNLLLNLSYMLLLLSYGMNVGVYYALSTLLNPVILKYFPGSEVDAGWIGLCMVMTGIFGSVAAGMVLDKTHKYKETNLALYAFTMICMWIFTFTLDDGHIAVVYVTVSVLGFFMTGYLPVGFEYAAELTYPISEFTSSGLLNASATAAGTIFTMAYSKLFYTFGDVEANVYLAVMLVIGTIISMLISSNLRRQAVQANSANVPN